MCITKQSLVRSLIGCVFCGGAVTYGQTTPPVSLNVNTSIRYQTITGFGSALANDSPVWQPQMQQLFAQDLGASMVRVPLIPDILPGQVTFGPSVQANANLFNFDTYPASTWGAFTNSVTSQRLDQMTIIGTVWTPPAWLKTNDSQNGGALIQTPDNLQQYARYLAAYVQGFQQYFHVPLYAISIQNELRFSEPYPSTVYNPAQYAATVKAVGAEFAADGITTKIFGPEDVGVDSGFLTNNQMSFINAVESDPVAKQYLNILAVHGYAGNGASPSSDAANWADYYNRVKNLGMQSWMTEESGENPAWIHYDSTGKPDGALSLALRIHQALAYGNVNAWVYWQTDDGKTPVSNFTLISGGSTTSLKYYAAKHYFRYIRPGDVRVDAGTDNANGVNIDAYVDDARHLMTIELINMALTDEPVTINIPADYAGAFADYMTTATQPWAVLPDVLSSNGTLTLTLPASSIVTLETDSTIGIVPEPASAALLACTAVMGLKRRR